MYTYYINNNAYNKLQSFHAGLYEHTCFYVCGTWRIFQTGNKEKLQKMWFPSPSCWIWYHTAQKRTES